MASGVEELLDMLFELVDEAKNMPLSSDKCVIERDRALDLIDDDKVCLTNLNRQILATRKTIGKYKVDVAKERILEINPDCEVRTYNSSRLY